MHSQIGQDFVSISVAARQRNAKAVRDIPCEKVAWFQVALTRSARRGDTMGLDLALSHSSLTTGLF